MQEEQQEFGAKLVKRLVDWLTCVFVYRMDREICVQMSGKKELQRNGPERDSFWLLYVRSYDIPLRACVLEACNSGNSKRQTRSREY